MPKLVKRQSALAKQISSLQKILDDTRSKYDDVSKQIITLRAQQDAALARVRESEAWSVGSSSISSFRCLRLQDISDPGVRSRRFGRKVRGQSSFKVLTSSDPVVSRWIRLACSF